MNDYKRVIVIGASAGGVDALLRIAPGLSSQLAAPILLVLHIGAHPSQMPELLNARGPNRAVFAHSGVVPIAGMIYVAPPDQHLLLQEGLAIATYKFESSLDIRWCTERCFNIRTRGHPERNGTSVVLALS